MKRIVPSICIFFILMGGFHSLSAQKIGYVNLEVIMALMPEMKKVNEDLSTYRQKLDEQLKIKSDYFNVKYQEYLEKQEAGVEAEELAPIEAELTKLQQEVQVYQQESEQKLAMKQQDSMQPLFDKIQGELDKISEAEGYDIIINAVDGSGLSIVLYGPEEDNLTKKLLDQMGIEVPDTVSTDN